MGWLLRTREIRCRPDCRRWTIDCRAADERVVVWADVTAGGMLLGLQTDDDYIGTTGSPELDEAIVEHVADELARRRTSQTLDQLDRPRGRSDRVRWVA
jgi:hypothetical protein